MSKIDVSSFDRMMRDSFPPPGQEPPEYVKRARAARAELERTGARVQVASHLDNTGALCRNIGPATLIEDMREHDCCGACNDEGDRLAEVDAAEPPSAG